MKKLLSLLFLLFLTDAGAAATLLPPGEQQFLGIDGTPLAGGYVYTYVPGTTTPKTTWSNSGQTVQNSNPVALNQGGFATIYGSGSYREIVQDAQGNTIYDAVTADTSAANTSWSGTAGGTTNALVLTANAFTAQDGQNISFIAQFTNTGSVTANVGGNVYQITEPGATGPVSLQGGEIRAGAVLDLTYLASSGTLQITNPAENDQFVPIPASATTDLGSTTYNNVTVSGSSTITSFGTSASIYFPFYVVTFTGNNTITFNATSLITASGENIYTQPNTTLTLQYLGSGNWQVLSVSNQILPGVSIINVQSGTTYAIVQSDQGKVVSFTNAAAIAVTIPQAIAPFDNGFYVDLQNIGSANITITSTTSNIAGGASFLIPGRTTARLVSDGSNWQVTNFSSLNTATLLNTIIATGTATVQDITSFTSAYAHYKIQFSNIGPSTSGVTCEIRVYSGGTFPSTGYLSVDQEIDAGGTGTEAPTTYIPCSYSSRATNAVPGINGTCLLDYPAGSGSVIPFTCTFTSVQTGGTGALVRLTSSGWFNTVGAITGLQVLFSSGNVAAGILQVYGWN